MTPVFQEHETDCIRDLVLDRRSIRAFADIPVPRSVVEGLLRDAMWAPSPHNAQPWCFTVLSRFEDRDRLAEAMAQVLTAELRADGLEEHMVERQSARSRARITGAPIAILCSLVTDGLRCFEDERRTYLERQMAVQSVGTVLQTLFLLARQEGLGTCWMAAPMYCGETVHSVLGLRPNAEPQALVLMGYPAHEGRKRERRPVSDVVDFR